MQQDHRRAVARGKVLKLNSFYLRCARRDDVRPGITSCLCRTRRSEEKHKERDTQSQFGADVHSISFQSIFGNCRLTLRRFLLPCKLVPRSRLSLAGGWPPLDPQRRLWVAHSCGFRISAPSRRPCGRNGGAAFRYSVESILKKSADGF